MGAIQRYIGGSKRSVRKLNALEFDPIEKLVDVYRKLEVELQRHEDIRSGARIELNSKGNQRAYDHHSHLQVFDRMIAAGKELLRYRYGKVPDGDEDGGNEKSSIPLLVELTGEGQVYSVQDTVVIEEDDGD